MNPYAMLAGCAVFVVTLLGAYWKGKSDESAKTEICKARNADLIASIETQNESIRLLKSASEKRMEISDKALKAAQAKTEKGRAEIARILSEKPVGDECKAAERLIREEAK